MTRFASGLAIACLALWLSACASTPEPVTKTEVVRVKPPSSLLEPCPLPEPTVDTNAQLADWTTRLVESLRACNGDKRALRLWSRSLGDGDGE